MSFRICKTRECGSEIKDKSRSKYCKACRSFSTHGIVPTARFFAEVVTQ